MPQINKVIYGNRTLIDLSNDTVSPDKVLRGVTAHMPDGSVAEGTFDTSVWYPTVNDDGEISWEKKNTEDAPATKNIKGDKGDIGDTPAITITASVDSSIGTPSVAVTKSGTAKAPSFKFAFSNLKGANGTSSILTFSNVSIPATAWASNTTQSAAGFGFRATIALSGVTSAMVPDVYLNVADAMSGDFSPVAQSYNGGIYIYASFKPTAALTIPTIRLTKS